MLKEFTVKDVVFLAILSAVLLGVSGLIMPIVMMTNIYGLRQLFSAPLFALFVMIALQKVPKIAALSFLGFFTGAVLLFMSVVMFFNNFLAAVILDLLVYLIFRTYANDKAKYLAASLYIPLTLPITLAVNAVMKGKSLAEQLGENLVLRLSIIAGTFVLSFLGALLGGKIAKELRKAGKL